MKFIPTFFAAATLAMAAMSPTAAQGIQIQGISYGGSGCPGGSASISVNPNGQELTILFVNKLSANNDRKSCNLSIPIRIPQGFQVSFSGIEYRGYVAPNTQASLRSEYFFAGSRGPIFSHTFTGETTYNIRDRLPELWSRCGDSVNMRVNTAVTARGSGIATVDPSFAYHIKHRRCQL
jgi:hypothetical protein